jgi:hypothetical protein
MLGEGVAAVGMRTKMAMAHCLEMMSRISEQTKGPFERSWSRNNLDDAANVEIQSRSRIGKQPESDESYAMTRTGSLQCADTDSQHELNAHI